MAKIYRATYEDLNEERIERIKKYLAMSHEQLCEIKDVWAIGEHIDKLRDVTLSPEWQEYDFVHLSPKAIIKKAYFLDLPTDKLFNNDILDFRYVTTLERWEKGLPVDPPTVSVNHERKDISVSDGRHRLVLSYILNKNSIPVAVLKEDIELLNILTSR